MFPLSLRCGVRWLHARRLVFRRTGDPVEVIGLESAQLSDDIPPGKVLVKWCAAPINPADLNQIQGVYPAKRALPGVGGNEGVAVVQKIGEGVRNLKEGDHVLHGTCGTGTWQDYSIEDAEKVFPIDNRLPLEVAAMMQVNPPTAYRMLSDFKKLRPGDAVIQNGATSAVGRAVIQICNARGIKTINLVRKRDDLLNVVDELRALGADLVITEEQLVKEYRNEVKNVPLALNCIGGRSTIFLANALGQKGFMVTYGGMSKQPIQVPTGPLIFRNIELRGYWMTRWYSEGHDEERTKMYSELSDLVFDGKLQFPNIQKRGLEEFKQALTDASAVFGKKQLFVC